MRKKIRYHLFALVCIVFLCLGSTYKYIQDDTFYIIKLGNFILSNSIDFIDHYSWVSSLNYTYPHWLFDVFIYIIYDIFSFCGVYSFTVILFIILIMCIYFVNLKIHGNWFLSFIISVISVFRLAMFAVARSQLVSLTLFLLEIYFINRLLLTGKKRYIVFLCLDSLLLANIHATTWLFYFVLFLPFFAEYFIQWFINNNFFKSFCRVNYNFNKARILIEKFKYFKNLLFAFILSFSMGIFTPTRICYSYVFRIMLGNTQKYLAEHLPLVVIEHPFFIVVIIILIITLILTKVKIYLREIFMICGLILMSLFSVRHLSFFYTIGILYIAIICYRYLFSVNDSTFDILGNIFINNKTVCFFTILFITCFSLYGFYNHSKEDFVLKDEYPVGAVNYIKDNLNYNDMRLYNEYNDGSYLLFNDIPVFIDARCDLYLKEFNGMKYSIFDDMVEITSGNMEKFEDYNFSHILISKNNIFYLLFSKDSNYIILYEDDFFVLFERIEEGM